jgi:DNA-binding MarR family transcriptional regulator
MILSLIALLVLAKYIPRSDVPRINTVLTPEQQEKYKQLEREARERHEERVISGSEPKQ